MQTKSIPMVIMLIVAFLNGALAEELPIRRVILYKHGVGYIERHGLVEDNAEITLRFKPADMSDMLKSLTVLDLGGGEVAAIVYDSTRTIDQQLDEYTFDLRAAGGVADVLGQLKGSEVALKVEGSILAGRLLAVENRVEPSDGQNPAAQYYLSVMLPNAAVREYNFRDINEIRFTDPALQRDLEKYLVTLFERHRRDEKQVVIRATGRGRRELLAAYIQEQPVWKVAYRLVMAEAKPPLLQGWAVVDNVSVDDWEKVELSLVSGLPVSFRQNLYDPFFVTRPEISVQRESAVGPVVHQPAAPRARMMKAARAAPREEVAFGMDHMEAAPARAQALTRHDLYDNMSRQAVAAVAREAGALFVYNIAGPVSIARNQSALLPIANSAVTARRLALYNPNVRQDNPMDAVHLKNDTGLTLEGGPLTVLEDNTYVGEALLDTLKPDEERYVSFAVDLGTRISFKHNSTSQNVYSVKILRGSMITYHRQQQTRRYTALNLEDKPKHLVLEHPRRGDWQLTRPAEPAEITEDYYRFALALPPNATETLEVIEEQPGQTTISLSNINSDQIRYFMQQKYIDRAARQFMEQLVALQAEIQQLREQIQLLQNEREGIFNNQTRLRENLQALGQAESERAYRSRIVRQLEEQEDRLAQIDRGILQHEIDLQAKQEQRDRRLTEFTFKQEL